MPVIVDCLSNRFYTERIQKMSQKMHIEDWDFFWLLSHQGSLVSANHETLYNFIIIYYL